MRLHFSSHKLSLIAIIVVVFYVSILLYSDTNQILENTSAFKFDYLPIIFVLMATQLLLLGIKFHRILKKLKINLHIFQSIKIFIAGMSLIATPGGVGTAIKSQILHSKYQIPVSKTLPIIFIERLTELLGILFILSIFFIWTNMIESLLAISLGTIFSLIMYILISKKNTFKSFQNILLKIKKLKNLTDSLNESKDSFSILTEKKFFTELLLWSFLSKFAQFLAINFIFLSLDVDLGFFYSGQIYYTSLVLGSLSFLPSGIIITESTMMTFLINHGVQISIASLLVIFTRLITTWLGTILGVIMLKLVQNEKT